MRPDPVVSTGTIEDCGAGRSIEGPIVAAAIEGQRLDARGGRLMRGRPARRRYRIRRALPVGVERGKPFRRHLFGARGVGMVRVGEVGRIVEPGILVDDDYRGRGG